MNIASAPAQLIEAWAAGDSTKTNPIPVASQQSITPGAASWTDGFPPLCAQPLSAGGIPPSKSDMNGGMYQMSAVDVWMSAGAGFPYNSGFSTAIGGYPKGSRVLMGNGLGYWRSIADNNTTDPDTGGSGWVPDTRSRVVASVYASAQQTIATPSGAIIFDTVDFDPFGMWNATGHVFVAPWEGSYRISGSVMLSSPDGQLLATWIYKNGSLAKQCFQVPQVSDGDLTLPYEAVISLTTGDTVAPFLACPLASVLAGQVGSNQIYVFGNLEYLG